MDSSVVSWEFLVIAFIFTATIIASEFVRRWLEKIEKDNSQSETETSNLVFAETDCQSCDPHFLVVEETDESVPMDSSSLRLFVECADKGRQGLCFDGREVALCFGKLEREQRRREGTRRTCGCFGCQSRHQHNG